MRWLDDILINGHECEQSLGNLKGREAWHAAIRGVAESDTIEQLNDNEFRKANTTTTAATPF